MDIAIDLPSGTDAPTLARKALASWGGVLAPDVLDDLEIVVTELVANSVVHGHGAPIRLRVSLGPDGLLRGEVADDGEGTVQIRDADLGRSGGLGLRIVDRLTDRWGVYEGSTHVWFEIDVTRR